MNHALRTEGLTRAEVLRLTGLSEGQVDALWAEGRLRATPEGYATYASVLTAGDDVVAAQGLPEPEEEYGQAHLTAGAEPASLRLYFDLAVTGGHVGVGATREKALEVRVIAQGARPRNVTAIDKDAMAFALDHLRHRLSVLAQGGQVDVVTTDNWLARLLSGRMRGQTERIEQALAELRETLSARHLTLRPHFLKESVAARGRGVPVFDLMMTTVLASRIAAVGSAYVESVPPGEGAPALLLPRAEAAARQARETYLAGRQAEIAKELFRHAPGEDEARARFETLARDTHATYTGRRVGLPGLLPGPVEGGIGALDEGGARPLSRLYGIGEDLAERWIAWWRDYAGILARHPVLALREALLKLDGETRMSRWPRIKHERALLWTLGEAVNLPFRIPADRRGPTEAAILRLVRECGGWPFPPAPEGAPRGKGRSGAGPGADVPAQ